MIPGPCCCSARSASASTTPPPPCTTNWPISAGVSWWKCSRQYADGDPSTPIPQEEALATYAAKLTKADGHIDWDEDAAVIHARIRGVTPWPGAQTVFLLPGRDPLPALLQPGRVGETFTGGHPAPGTLVALRGGKLLIACRDALYEVSTLKPAGGKPMSAEAFWNGYCRAANKDGCGRAVSPSLG